MRRRSRPRHCTKRRKPIESGVRMPPSCASRGVRLRCISCTPRTCDLRWKSKSGIETACTVFCAENDRWIPFIVVALFTIAVAVGVLVGQSAA